MAERDIILVIQYAGAALPTQLPEWALQMIECGRRIPREAVPFRRFDRQVVGGIGRCRGARFL